MAFALLIIGITFLVAGVRGTHTQLTTLLIGDFTGPNNYLYWILAIMVVGSIGYVDRLKPLANGLLVLIILALFLTKGRAGDPSSGGFFEKFMAAIGSTENAPVSSGGVGAAIAGALGVGVPAANQGSGPNGSWTAADKIAMDQQPVNCPPGMTYQGIYLGCR